MTQKPNSGQDALCCWLVRTPRRPGKAGRDERGRRRGATKKAAARATQPTDAAAAAPRLGPRSGPPPAEPTAPGRPGGAVQNQTVRCHGGLRVLTLGSTSRGWPDGEAELPLRQGPSEATAGRPPGWAEEQPAGPEQTGRSSQAASRTCQGRCATALASGPGSPRKGSPLPLSSSLVRVQPAPRRRASLALPLPAAGVHPLASLQDWALKKVGLSLVTPFRVWLRLLLYEQQTLCAVMFPGSAVAPCIGRRQQNCTAPRAPWKPPVLWPYSRP